MKHSMMLLAFLLTALLAVGANAQDADSGRGESRGVCQFIDEDGDGFNDLAPDADGDGIPNGLDPDYVKPQDGTGLVNRWTHRYGELFHRYFGEDAVAGRNGPGAFHYGSENGNGFGPGMGSGDSPGEGGNSGSQQQAQERRDSRRK